ncbi:MAG: hypothetical protein J2P19_08185, partial [Pseudonocardia sp.]|nr:hypothetical protein [Pseudonocardia sp.]
FVIVPGDAGRVTYLDSHFVPKLETRPEPRAAPEAQPRRDAPRDNDAPAAAATAAPLAPRSGWLDGHGPSPGDLARVPELLNAGPDVERPSWWPTDSSGYPVRQRDLDALGITQDQMKALVAREAPLGMTRAEYQRFRSELVAALERDGLNRNDFDIRLLGSAARFFSGPRKQLPSLEDPNLSADSRRFLADWLSRGNGHTKPRERPFDSGLNLDPESAPSDYDLNISSTKMVDIARSRWPSDRYQGDFMGGHGYVDQGIINEAFPVLEDWKKRWEARMQREVSIGLFESSGPFNEEKMGRPISVHMRDTDWVIHRPEGR